MSKKKAEQLTIEGEEIHTILTHINGPVDTGGNLVLHRGTTFSFVGKATTNEYGVKVLKKKITRVQPSVVSRAVIVDDELAEDVLAAHEEFTTGQMRLLSLEGEDRRAARSALARLRSLREDKGFTPESDDGAFEAPAAFLDQAVRAHEAKLTSLFAEADGMGTAAYLEACEEELTQAAATLLAGVTYCRRALGRHHENEARARQVTVDESGTALTADEVAAQQEKAAAKPKRGKAKDGGLMPGDDGSV